MNCGDFHYVSVGLAFWAWGSLMFLLGAAWAARGRA